MIAARVRDAHGARQALRITGAGRWLDAGRPVTAAAPLSLAGERGIVEYVPGDLTLTARAGTPIAEIVAATKAEGQWLPLDPWGGDAGTIGATVSTATPGPHAHAMGLPRDVVLGMEFITGTGATVRAGGRVVKNVAGFDLTRVLIGSWGTLGVITEVTVRLRARPASTRTVALDATLSAGALNELAARLRALPFTPLASELVNAALANRLGFGPRPTLLLRLGGNGPSLHGQLAAIAAFGPVRDAPADVWRTLREDALDAAWRCSQLPSVFGETWIAAETATRDLDPLFLHGNPARGVVRVAASGEPARLARAAASFSDSTVVERLPGDAWRAMPPRKRDTISQAIRQRFDPAGILNPGILGEDA
jgi:glycolate oxidase FAD binding subunit